MERQLKAGIAVLMLSYFGACAPVTFDAAPSGPQPNVVKKCTTANQCYYEVTDSWAIGEGKVDILIVNDNSGSMSYEQNKMAAAFTGFLTSLNTLDYRIAMTTTDVSDTRARINGVTNAWYNPPGPYNGYGALQDGKLIQFVGSQSGNYLMRGESNISTLFDNTIRRPETANCEASGYTQCPSGDERGIMAANMTIQNYSGQFMRPDAHLAVIVLADEDERGVSKYNPCSNPSLSTTEFNQYCAVAPRSYYTDRVRDYGFEPGDEPSSFVSNFKRLFPSKTMSWNSIIVKNRDASCLGTQSSQGLNVLGAYGSAYQELSRLTGGKVGSICESNFTNQLQDIGYMLQETPKTRPVKCVAVDVDGDGRRDFKLFIDGEEVLANAYTVNYDTMTYTVTAPLAPSTKIDARYSCPL